MKNRNGFTFIELIVFLALLGIVLAIVFRIFFLGQVAFDAGSAQYQLQSDLRDAGDFIMDELRNATEVIIMDTPPSSVKNREYSYIYLKDSKLTYEFDEVKIDLTEPVIDDTEIFRIRKDADGRNFLSINLNGKVNDNTYNLATEILLKNVGNLETSSGRAIKYNKAMP